MTLVLTCVIVVAGLEIVLWLSGVKRGKSFLAYLVLVAIVASTAGYIALSPGLLSGIFGLFSVYRVFNVLRAIRGHAQVAYLLKVTRRTSLWLIAFQAAVLGTVWTYSRYTDALSVQYVFLLTQLAVASVLAECTQRHLKSIKRPTVTETYAEYGLPTLTVAIPARNETHDLEACLQTLVATKYPKLEILVLDDCSQNARTPEIIRQYAHDGVRFIAGKVPASKWVAKTYAYDQLAAAASGEIILFCGVDTRFEPLSIRHIVETMLYKEKSMVSVIPQNRLPAATRLEALMVQPSRYVWELALPRRWLHRPSVLSTCWLITRDMLRSVGGFAAVSHSTSPEHYFAQKAIEHNDGYSFFESDMTIGLRSAKSFDEQRLTAIRTRYPQLHRRPEIAALLSLAEIAFIIMPYVFLVAFLVRHEWVPAAVAAGSVVLLTYVYARITNLTYRRFVFRSLWLLPFAAVYDVGLLNYSMWKYEFSEVIWKGRNVCLPVMQTYARLPHLR